MENYRLINKIKKPSDIKKFNMEELKELSKEIRRFLLEKVSKNGGHLASNLGVVELTEAICYSLDLEKDKVIWDVGHQSYVYKILTGRREDFETLRQFNGKSGFPKTSESIYESFNTGHSSTSIAGGLGYVYGRDIKNENYKVISVIGDGALTGGLAFEALNNMAMVKTNYTVILNDNNMSISKNTGGLSKNLSSITATSKYIKLKKSINKFLEIIPLGGNAIKNTITRTKNGIKQMLIPGMYFENMGIKYIGPIDGHNTKEIIKALKEAIKIEGPVLVHVNTIKGKGYKFAEESPDKFHGIGPFNIKTGKSLKKSSETYTNVFSKTLVSLGKENKNIVAITAAMDSGTGLIEFREKFPNRFFDVGIAEGCATTLSASLNKSGLIPVFAVYSSFLQRGFDNLIHDMALQNAHGIFAIDRGGLVGEDGETHHGLFDISYMCMIPNMTVMAPKNGLELKEMLKFSIGEKGPIAIRYPRGSATSILEEFNSPIVYGKAEMIYEGKDILLLGFGSSVETLLEVYNKLVDDGFSPTLYNMRFAKPIDKEMLKEMIKTHNNVVVVEEGVLNGGLGSNVSMYLNSLNYKGNIITYGIDDRFITHGDIPNLKKVAHIDSEYIYNNLLERIKKD